MKIKFLSLAMLAVFSVGQAQAHNLDAFAPGEQHAVGQDAEYATINSAVGTSYSSDYYFTLDNTYFISATAVVNSRSSVLSGNMISLYSHLPGMSPVLQGSFTYAKSSTDHDFGNMSAGSYYYELSGMNDGDHINQIALQSFATAVTPVPEPETCAMLLAGLGVMGVIARRLKSV